MAISYNNLWKTLIDKGINKSELCKKVKISTSTMAKMTNGEPVNLSTLERICKELDCSIEDVVEIKNTEDIQAFSTLRRYHPKIRRDTCAHLRRNILKV